jgi:hypothetical protein
MAGKAAEREAVGELARGAQALESAALESAALESAALESAALESAAVASAALVSAAPASRPPAGLVLQELEVERHVVAAPTSAVQRAGQALQTQLRREIRVQAVSIHPLASLRVPRPAVVEEREQPAVAAGRQARPAQLRIAAGR